MVMQRIKRKRNIANIEKNSIKYQYTQALNSYKAEKKWLYKSMQKKLLEYCHSLI